MKTVDVLIKGKIFTADKKLPYAEAAAINDGKFVFVGSYKDAKRFIGPDTSIFESDGGLIIPGMTDAHAHVASGSAQKLLGIDLFSGESTEDYCNMIREFIEKHPQTEVISGFGWVNGVFGDELPNRKILDAVSTDKAIVLQSADCHSIWANSKAMEMAGIGKGYVCKEEGEVVLDPESQEPIGLFREWAMFCVNRIVPEYKVEEVKQIFLDMQKEYLSHGVTAVYEPIMEHSEVVRKAYEELDDENKLEMRVTSGFYCYIARSTLETLNEYAKLRDMHKGKLYHNNCIKFVLDGVVEGNTAYLLDDYIGQPGYKGVNQCTQEEINAYTKRAKELGFQIHDHAIGDGALDMALTSIEYAQSENPVNDWRPTITHLQIVRKSDIQRMKKDGVVACTNPYWHWREPEYYQAIELPSLGPERAEHEFPLKDFFDAEIPVSTATDYPCTIVLNPMYAIQIGHLRRDLTDVNGLTASDQTQRVLIEQMIESSTIYGAYQNFGEKEYGSIEVGKSADCVFLERDITEINPYEIYTTKVNKTLFKGKVVYEKNNGKFGKEQTK